MTTIEIIRDHIDGKHPGLIGEGCPVCEKMLELHRQEARPS